MDNYFGFIIVTELHISFPIKWKMETESIQKGSAKSSKLKVNIAVQVL